MFASDLVNPYSHANGVLMLETRHAHTMAVLGSSFGQAPAAKDNFSNVFYFNVPKECDGVIVLQVRKCNHNTGDLLGYYYFFVGVEWLASDEYPRADLERQWVSKVPHRMGNVMDKELSVKVGDVVYTTGKARPHEVHVEDGNLICRYMNGNIDEEEFRKEVGAPARQRQLAEDLRKEVESCKTTIRTLEHERILQENRFCQQSKRSRDWRGVARLFHDAASQSWWQRKRLLSIAIQAFKRLSLLESEEEEEAATYQDRLR